MNLEVYIKEKEMDIDEIKIRWLEESLKELGRHDEFKNMESDELAMAYKMGIDELREKYGLKAIYYVNTDVLREQGARDKAIEIAEALLDVLDVTTIALKTGLSIDEVKMLERNLQS